MMNLPRRMLRQMKWACCQQQLPVEHFLQCSKKGIGMPFPAVSILKRTPGTSEAKLPATGRSEGRRAREVWVRSVAGADLVRRQNRALVLATLRRNGALSRTQLAAATGLSHASMTSIGGDLINEGILIEGDALASSGARGRPAVEVRFSRRAAYAVVVELDVNRTRCTLADYAGNLVDRTELAMTGDLFEHTSPRDFLIGRIEQIRQRNPEEAEVFIVAPNLAVVVEDFCWVAACCF